MAYSEIIVADSSSVKKKKIFWNAENQPSGVYFCKLVNIENDNVLSVKKVTLMK